jgi:hypothetical protein
MGLNLTTGDAGFTLDGLRITGGSIMHGARNLTIRNATFTGALTLDGLADSNILLERNTHRNIMTCPACTPARLHFSYGSDTPSGVTVKDSLFEGGNADGIQTGVGVDIIGNEFRDIHETGPDDPAHTDPIQLIGAPHSVVRGNYIHHSADGIVAYDGVEDALIEDNVVEVANGRWGIELYADDGSVIRHNTLVHGTGCMYAACGFIMLDRKSTDPAGTGTVVVDNIATDITQNNGSAAAVRHHNLVRSSPGAGDLGGSPVFAGGPAPTTYAGFALAPGSPGKGGGSDGQDIGITP